MKFLRIYSFKNSVLSLILISIFFPITQGDAAWKQVGTDQDGPFYIDTTAIKKEKGFVFYEVLADYARAGRSSVSSVQADCTLGRIKLLQAKAYSGPMARGSYKVYKLVPRWVSAEKNEVIEVMLSVVCQ